MLKQLIEQSGLSQKEIAQQLGINKTALSRLVNSHDRLMAVKYETIVKLCNILHCTPVDITPLEYEAGIDAENERAMVIYTKKEISGMFTADEKKYFADMLNTAMYTHHIPPNHFLRMQVLDSDEFEGLGKKWKVKASDLAQKVNVLSTFQAYTVIKLVKSWWKRDNRDIDNIF